MSRIATGFATLFVISLPLLAQNGASEETITVTAEAIERVDPTLVQLLMQETDWENPDTDIERQVAALLLAVARNETAKIERTNAVITRHRWSSWAGFVLAHLLVLLGLTIGVLEFRQARRLRQRGAKAERMELSIGLEGLAVKSSLNGLLILFLCFAFYLAFLHFIYPLASI